jgi:PKD repeat protein
LFKPSVNFASLDTCLNKQPLQFVNSSVNATSYQWSFGDGNVSNLTDPTNHYTTDGSYQVTLIGYNTGCSDTLTKTVAVYPVPGAAFTVPSSFVCGVPANIGITNNSTGAGGYAWDFGNGTTSTATNPVANYTAQGTYNVSLIASNHYGCYDTAQAPVQIYAYPTVQSIDVTPPQGCQPYSVSFAANTLDANNFVWNFGDGSPLESGSAVTQHFYTDTGTFTVTFEVYNFGCGDTIVLTDTVTVHSLPIADFDYYMNDEVDSAIGLVQFTNGSIDATHFTWSFGDGDSSILVNPSHLYPNIDHYNVILTAANDYGCIDTISKDIYIIKKSLYVPNAFAPDYNAGSTLVKVWQPVGMGLKDYHAQIFNTWGELLWESYELTADYQPAEGWDGTYQGKMCQQDVYVWKIDAVFLDGTRWKGMSYYGGPRKMIGDVTIIR